ncbi:MAG: RHS repeat-associated core domain-containing protein [Kofleriaceae bacterium]
MFNLGWGHRPNNGWPTVEAMMLDIDGDGLIDRVQSEPMLDGAGNVQFCRARWYRNRGPAPQGSDQFQLAGDIDMPTLKWSSPGGSGFTGGAYARQDTIYGVHERCALNYQRTAYRNSTVGFLSRCSPGGEPCPDGADGVMDGIGVCLGTHSDCGINKSTSAETHFAWRWMDVDGDQLPDLIGSPITGGVGSYDLQRGNANPFPPPSEPLIFGSFPQCPSPSYTGSTNWNADQYTMCHGMFPWFIYKNHGKGVFGQARGGGSGLTHGTWGPLPDQIVYQPVPLESANGDSSVTSKPVGQFDATVDIDGDGFVDAIKVFDYPANQWKVYRNDGTGRMVASSGTSQFVFETNFYLFPSRTDYTPSPNPTPAGVEGLLDLNGDGLVDQWRSLSGDPSQATVHYNDGVRFRATGALPVSDRLGPDGYPVVSSATGTPLHYVCAGTRTDSRRTHDIDQDGRADLIRFNTGSTIPTTRFNFGGRFGGPALQLGFGAAHTIQVRSDNDNNPCEGAGWWETLGDLIDLDGDGVEEDVHFTSISGPPNQMQVRYGTSVPRRLMVSVKNGRGATTSISYSSMNGPAVTQSPAEGNTSPSTNWVVQSVATTDDFPSTTSTSTYKYKNPQWSPDQDADVPTAHSFRGFEQVETTSPSGAVTIERFSYSPDWSGRLATRIIKPSSGTIVHTIDDTTWEAFTLFNGLITTYLATATEHWTCTSTQTEKTCRTNVDTYTRTATQFSPLKSTSTTEQTTLMWQPTTTLLQAALAPAMSDRGTVTTYALYSDASSYRLRPLTVTKNVILPGGTFAMYAKSASTWDAARGLKLTDEEWIDNSDATRLITTNTYDAIGNLIAVQDPRGHTVENEYDSRQLFVSAVNNEYYDHHYEYDYEYGTGATLATRGPLWAWCATYQTPFCPSPPPPGFMVRNETRHRVDGLGRVIAKFESVNNDFNLYDYKLKQTEIHSYVDAATSTTPTSATHQTAIDETGVQIRYRSETTQFDGHGRPIKTTVAAPIAHVTAYSYRADGTLQSVSVPDPTKNDASLVTYTYGFDTVGRPTSIRRPDSTTAANQSGVNIAYNGLTSTTTEVVGSAGGKTGETQTINDRFGRLQFVKEKTGTNIYATTTYSYDAADNVATIVDPQGVTTTLVHDLAGRRTDITRAGRTWHYGYDGNDNLTSVRTPCTGLACAKYVTTYNYDPLNRETTRIIAPRELSTPDRELFVADSELRFWDYGANARDRVAQWFSYAPSSTETRLLNWFNYDPRGSVLMQTQRFKNAGLPLMTRDVMHDYHLSGLPYITRYREQNGEWPVKRTSYDGRGLTSSIEVSFDRGVTYPNQPTVQTRNVAGLVTKRRTNVTSGPMSFVESNWTYDKLGRVTNQTVQKSGPTQVARQALTYFGNDDVKTLQHFLGATSRTFSYTYDLRHQITGAIENDASYFKGGYQYGAAGRLTRVRHDRTATPPGADPRLVRYVNYVYGGTDPEQVTALTNVSNGSTYATYTYDDAGNQTTRAYPATNELFEYTYDGQDQLRRVVRKVSGVVQGSEEYWYGMDGNRTQVLKRDAAGNKTELIWFIEDVEAHYQVNVDGTTTLTKTYAHVSDGTPIARIERTGPDPATNKIEYQFHGLANNTLAAVAQNGTINASFSYAPFGELLESTNAGGSTQGTTAHKRRSNDKYEDDLGALTYYGARYYDKTLIGWTQSDPLYRFAPDSGWVKPRAANLYMFSLNNSSRYIDPDGQQAAELAGDLLKVGAGAATASTAGGGALATATAVAGPGLIVAGGMVMTMKALAPESGPGISIKHEGAYDQAAIQANNRAQAEARARSEQAFADNMAAFEEGVAQTTGRDTLEKDGGPAGRTAPNNAWQKPASKPGYVGNLAKPPRGRGSTPQGQRDKKRGYTSKERAAKRKEQKGKCATGCGTDIDENNSEGHHTTRHADGTPTDDAHHAEVCKDCHKELHRPD